VQEGGFLRDDLIGLVRNRGKVIVQVCVGIGYRNVKTVSTFLPSPANQARKVTPAMSLAYAVSDHLRDLWFGTGAGEIVSMGVYSDGNPYNIRPGIFFSFPIQIQPGGAWSVVGGLDMDDELREKLTVSRDGNGRGRNLSTKHKPLLHRHQQKSCELNVMLHSHCWNCQYQRRKKQ